MQILSIAAKFAVSFLTVASAQSQITTPSTKEPIAPKGRERVVCRQGDMTFSVQKYFDGTRYAIDLVNEKQRLAITYEALKPQYPNMRDEWVRERVIELAKKEAAIPSVVGACAAMQTCEFQEPGSPMLVECKNDAGTHKRRFTVQLNEQSTYEVKCEEWVSADKDAVGPTLESNNYTAFRKEIVIPPNSCF